MADRRAWRWGLGVGLPEPLAALVLFLAPLADWLFLGHRGPGRAPGPAGHAATQTREAWPHHYRDGPRAAGRLSPELPEDPPSPTAAGRVHVALSPLLRGKALTLGHLGHPQAPAGRPRRRQHPTTPSAWPARPGRAPARAARRSARCASATARLHAAIVAGLKADFNVDSADRGPVRRGSRGGRGPAGRCRGHPRRPANRREASRGGAVFNRGLRSAPADPHCSCPTARPGSA